MNTRRCISFVLLLCVCFYVVFSLSHTVYASEYDPTYYITSDEANYIASGFVQEDGSTNFSYTFVDCEYGRGLPLGDSTGVVRFYINRLLDAGTYDIQVKVDYIPLSTPEGIVCNNVELALACDSGYVTDWIQASSCYYTEPTSGDPYLLITFKNIEARADFRRFLFKFYFTASAVTNDGGCDINLHFSKITLDAEDKTLGLLDTIISAVQNIWNGITQLPSNIANSLKSFFDNIVNAVVNLGTTIIDGIKGLFIPSEEDITNMKDKWDTLLSDRFGALYQVAGLISDYAAAFKEQNKNTITFPKISIPLGEANFEFGGWEVQVIPDGFDFLIEALKLITSIACTLLFINGLRDRYDKIMGGADDI